MWNAVAKVIVTGMGGITESTEITGALTTDALILLWERCTDSCYFSGLRSCVGNYVTVCGNFDSDPCLELNYTEYCEYGCEMGVCKEKNECEGTFTGTVKRVIDGDTIELEECKEKIRLALVDTPEYYEEGYTEAKKFTEGLCRGGSKVTVNQDDDQPYDIYGRIVGVVYCNGKNLNAELVYRGLGKIKTEFCEKSEFAREEWAWNYGCRDVLEGEYCHPSYPEICIPSPPPDLDCSDIPYRNFVVKWDVPDPDPHGFDKDKDGIGCEG